MLIFSPSALTRSINDQMVVSVGPYMFHTSPRSTNSPANSAASASPPHKIFSPFFPFHPASTSMRHVAGVACIIVIFRSISSPSPTPSLVISRLTTRTTPPVVNGRYSSSPAISKDSVVTASSTSSGPIPGSSRIVARKLVSAPWLTPTPLGFPLDPDV